MEFKMSDYSPDLKHLTCKQVERMINVNNRVLSNLLI